VGSKVQDIGSRVHGFGYGFGVSAQFGNYKLGYRAWGSNLEFKVQDWELRA
jgi:hypothetical protein